MISVAGVSFSYDGGAHALDGVDLEVREGEFLCILGGNGSGKSTLAKHLNALLVPDAGRVTVDGLDTADADYVYDIRSRVGLVFQNPDDQLVATLVEDDVAFGPENLGAVPAAIARDVETALAEVGLSGFERRETHALSGGQKQRVAIAGVLAMKPKVIVFDEATSMLDPRGRRGLMRVARDLHDRGLTVVMITHFMEEAAAADRVVVLDRGRVALEGTPDEVLTRTDVLAGLELDVPPACELALALRGRGLPVTLTVEEEGLADEVARLLAACDRRGAGSASVQADPRRAGGAPSASDAAPGSTTLEVPTAAAVPPRQAGGPLLVFERVSYSYEPSSRERARRLRLKRDARDRRVAWGGDPNEVWALREVDLTVHRGEFLGIAGHTGSGKSTLIQHMNGLIHPQEGRVLVDGEDLSDRRAAARVRSRVGVVFQYPEHQLFASTVFEDVAFGPRNLGLPEDEVDRRVRASLARVGLDAEEVGSKSPFSLSGGQQRRVAFAGVLAMEPEVLVLDEPAAGLDPAARRAFLDLVAALNDQGLTVVMVSHSMEDLARLADRIAVLNEGRIVAVGAPREVFAAADELERIGLGLPVPERMARALSARGVALSGVVHLTIGEVADDIARSAAVCGAAGAGEVTG